MSEEYTEEQLAQVVRDRVREADERLAAEYGDAWKNQHKREQIQNQARDYGRRIGLTTDDLDRVYDYRQAKALIDASRAEQTESEKRKAEDRDINHWRENFKGTPSPQNAGKLLGKIFARAERRKR